MLFVQFFAIFNQITHKIHLKNQLTFYFFRHLRDKKLAQTMGDDEEKETARSIAKAQGLQFHCIPTERCGAINVYVQGDVEGLQKAYNPLGNNTKVENGVVETYKIYHAFMSKYRHSLNFYENRSGK